MVIFYSCVNVYQRVQHFKICVYVDICTWVSEDICIYIYMYLVYTVIVSIVYIHMDIY